MCVHIIYDLSTTWFVVAIVTNFLSPPLLPPRLSPPEPYTQKDIRIHLQRLRELLTVSPFQQSLTNADGMTLSLLSAITLRDPEGQLLHYFPIHFH